MENNYPPKEVILPWKTYQEMLLELEEARSLQQVQEARYRNRQEFRNAAADILRENITFSPQTDNYIIHGALDKLWDLYQSTAAGEGEQRKLMEGMILNFYQELKKYQEDPSKLTYPGYHTVKGILEGIVVQYTNYFGIQTIRHGTTNK